MYLVNNNLKDIFGQNWSTITSEIKSKSQYKDYKSLSIESFIAKSNDDLRQEVMTMQLIKKFKWNTNKFQFISKKFSSCKRENSKAR